jgi:hypothetical protein
MVIWRVSALTRVNIDEKSAADFAVLEAGFAVATLRIPASLRFLSRLKP